MRKLHSLLSVLLIVMAHTALGQSANKIDSAAFF